MNSGLAVCAILISLCQYGIAASAASAASADNAEATPPEDASAWRSRGLGHLKLHESSAAFDALSKALILQPDDASLLIPLGIAAAQLGQTPEALCWLRKAKATHRVDMTQLEVESDLAALRSNPEFAALLPAAEEFAHPFLENVNIIREWDGEAAGDQFGWIARAVGDVDGDGVNDFVTSAPTKDSHGKNAGRIYAYSGATGALLWSVDGAPGDQLGTGLDTAGDVDGDGYADIIVGAPGNNANGKGAGRAYVYSGRDGHLLLALNGERADDAFGSTVAGYAADKHRFLVVGAPGAGPHQTGRVYVYRDLAAHVRAAHPAFVIDADSPGVALGFRFVSVLGDVDGDGVPDIFASDWSDAGKGPRTGKTYVYSGRTGHRLYTLTGETAGESFGTTQSVAGDVDGDGGADLIVGSWQYSGAAEGGGRAYLFDGREGRLLRTYTCRIPGDTFGFDAVGMGAFDAMGEAELLITSGWSGVRGYHSGRVFLISSGVRPYVPKHGGRWHL